jgi:hypothetical protein
MDMPSPRAGASGDGAPNIAALARSKESEKLGIAICYGTQSGIFFAEAGIVFGNGDDDFIWMDVWQVCLGYSAAENAPAQPSSSPSG